MCVCVCGGALSFGWERAEVGVSATQPGGGTSALHLLVFVSLIPDLPLVYCHCKQEETQLQLQLIEENPLETQCLLFKEVPHTNNTKHTHLHLSQRPLQSHPSPPHHITGLQYFTSQIRKQCQSYIHTWQHKYAAQ